MIQVAHLRASRVDASAVAAVAVDCLRREVATYPKPGLVSHIDNGAHDDMDAALLNCSTETLLPFFIALAEAGAAGHSMDRLRVIGIEAERAMLAATQSVNTHRGAIFGLGLLCAAAGFRQAYGLSARLGKIVALRWGAQILAGPLVLHSHGAVVGRRYGVGGARMEAAAGFPTLYDYGLPALWLGRRLAPQDEEAARVQLCMALISRLEDTNLLHRGGTNGLDFARQAARSFLAQGGVARSGWRDRAHAIHQDFVARDLSPGGSADLLAMTLFVDALEKTDVS
jgi:triphosphoribosyl-dephospho-CoA synthase